MRIHFTGRHMDVTDALKEHATEKLQRLERLVDSSVEAHVTFTVEKYRHLADVTLRTNGLSFAVAKETNDMYSAVDRVVDTLERKIRRHKERVADRRTRPAKRSTEPRDRESEEAGEEVMEVEEV